MSSKKFEIICIIQSEGVDLYVFPNKMGEHAGSPLLAFRCGSRPESTPFSYGILLDCPASLCKHPCLHLSANRDVCRTLTVVVCETKCRTLEIDFTIIITLL